MTSLIYSGQLEDQEQAIWPAPVPFRDEVLVAMPKDILPGTIGHFASALSDSTETPPELATLMTLGAVSCALGGKLLVEAEPGYREPCHLYVCCALESSNRKTAVVNAVTGPLSTWKRKQRELMAPAIQQATSERKTLEAVIEKARSKMSGDLDFSEEMVETQQRIAELEASLPVIPVAPLLWTSDSTQEKIECLLAEQGQRFAWISDEGGIFDILAGRYSKGLNLDVFLKGHAGSQVRVHRTSREEVILERPALTLAVSPQPGMLRTLQGSSAFRDRGMLARMLYAVPESNVGNRSLIPRPIRAEVKQAYVDVIERMLDWQPEEPIVLSLDPDAYTEWKDFQRSVESDMRDGGRPVLCPRLG